MLSGVASIRTGLPFNVTLSRPTTVMADGNNTSEPPSLGPDVSLIPPGGQTISDWINRAAFPRPANDTWGNAGTDIVTGPGLFQIDTELSWRVNFTERLNLMIRMEVFNGSITPTRRTERELLLELVRPDYGGEQHHPHRHRYGAQHSVRRVLHVPMRGVVRYRQNQMNIS